MLFYQDKHVFVMDTLSNPHLSIHYGGRAESGSPKKRGKREDVLKVML